MDLKAIQQLQSDISTLLEKMGVDFIEPEVEVGESQTVKVDLKVQDESTEDSQNLGILIGNHGETLAALEYIVALMVNRGREEWFQVKVDVDGYRARREDDLKQLATKLADKAKFLKEPVEMRPMSNADRRIIHLCLGEVAGVETESTGEGRNRRVVIKPA